MGRRIALALALAFASVAAAESTGPGAPARLLLIDPLPEGVDERIAGQIADLAWRAEHARAGALNPSTAAALASERDARAVAAVSEDARGFTLRVFDVRARRLLERRFEREPA